MAWYSTSDRVCAGATVIESPVCTPMGSKFSIEHTTTQLSTRSRMTSSSNSFHPAMDRSIRIWCTGLAARPFGRHPGQLGSGVGRPGARPPQDEAGADHEREADALAERHGLVEVRGEARRRDLEADLLHGGLELVAVLGGGDGLGVGADELHAEGVEDARARTGRRPGSGRSAHPWWATRRRAARVRPRRSSTSRSRGST